MRFTPISEVAEISSGTIIEGIQGTAKAISKHTPKDGANGPYTFQFITLLDTDRNEIEVAVFDQDDLSSLAGKFISLVSGKDKNKKTAGLTVQDKAEKKRGVATGKMIRNIKADNRVAITPSGPVSQLNAPAGEAEPDESEAQKLLRERREAEARGQKPPAEPAPATNGGQPAKVMLAKMAHLMFLCRKAMFLVSVQCESEDKRNVCGQDALQGMTSTLFIAAKDRGLERDLAVDFTKATGSSASDPLQAEVTRLREELERANHSLEEAHKRIKDLTTPEDDDVPF